MLVEPAQLLLDRAFVRAAISGVQLLRIVDHVHRSAPPQSGATMPEARGNLHWLCRQARVSLASWRWRFRPMSVLVRREQRSEGGHLAHVTIDNIGRLNSLNRELMVEIVSAVAVLDNDPELRLAILRGAGGPGFVGGADVG